MSDFVEESGLDLPRNPSTMHGLPGVARCVHSVSAVMIVVLAAVLLGGCPPPPLSLDEPDAAGNFPPSILSVRGDDAAEFRIGTSNEVFRGQSTMTVTVFDADVADTIYVRGFFDYDETAPDTARVFCELGPSPDPVTIRNLNCSIGALCRATDTAGIFSVVVSDRQPDDNGELEPQRWATMPPGLQSVRSYEVTCQDPAPI